jgi:hypothetical protein
VFPDLPRRPRHHVDRTWPSLERKTFPPWCRRAFETGTCTRSPRQAEHPVEVRLVSVPADADTDVVLGAKDLTNSGAPAAESFPAHRATGYCCGRKPGPRNRLWRRDRGPAAIGKLSCITVGTAQVHVVRKRHAFEVTLVPGLYCRPCARKVPPAGQDRYHVTVPLPLPSPCSVTPFPSDRSGDSLSRGKKSQAGLLREAPRSRTAHKRLRQPKEPSRSAKVERAMCRDP